MDNAAKKILVVEDDDFFRNTISDYLSNKYEVSSAANGRAALKSIESDNFDLIITDIKMPLVSGIELLKSVKETKEVNFIIMSGFAINDELHQVKQLGAKNFFLKPFSMAELDASIDIIFSKKNEKKCNSENFCKIPINDFISKPKLDFDIYIQLSSTNFVKLANYGEKLPIEQINQYKLKGIKYLHISKEDLKKIVQLNLNVSKALQSNPDISSEKKVNFLKYTGEILLKNIFIRDLSSEAFNDTKLYLDLTADIISDSLENITLLQSLIEHSEEVYAHSVAVSFYSVLIARKMQIHSLTTHYKLSMAGFFHDIGKKEIDPAILKKQSDTLSSNERKTLESHVMRGTEILSSIKNMPGDVIRIVSEHHEDCSGGGFPQKKPNLRQHPLSKIIQGTNTFLKEAAEMYALNRTVKPLEVIENIQRNHAKKIDSRVLIALKLIFSDN